MYFHFQIRIEGLVQGIGFRPFVYKLALELGLGGWVRNDTEGVTIEIEASQKELDLFLVRLKSDKPTQAEIRSLTLVSRVISEKQWHHFEIRKSEAAQSWEADVLPDLTTCDSCLKEISDPQNRRYQYLFTNCTLCGPRFSIVQALPYDRKNTTMAHFSMCRECQEEYENPLDRRFHAQPNACAHCGPQLQLVGNDSATPQIVSAEGIQAVEQAVSLLRQGSIVAIKGIGGYQLAVDAANEEAVQRLRQRKGRSRKPFAVMMNSLLEVQRYCQVSPREGQALQSTARPIVLLTRASFDQRSTDSDVGASPLPPLAPAVAPNNPYLGVFLPNSPLHFWLLKVMGGPLVLTSANFSDEPLVYRDEDALERLKDLADFFLTHNRAIARPIDDSVVQVVEDRVFVLRGARGLAPITIPKIMTEGVLATGPHMKATFALSLKKKILVSSHLGDLESHRTQELFESEVKLYSQFHHWKAQQMIADAHPGYFTHQWAKEATERARIPLAVCQHHEAHIYASLAENEFEGSYIGIAWDGTGFGQDQTIWGGEFFTADSPLKPLRRIGHLVPFRLLGGEAAIHAPWRVALSLLLEVDEKLAQKWFEDQSLPSHGVDFQTYRELWHKKINAPQCTSVGRLMEGIASLLGLGFENQFEADLAMQLEFAGQSAQSKDSRIVDLNAFPLLRGELFQLDWRPWITEAAHKILQGAAPEALALQLHQLLVKSIWEVSQLLHQKVIVLGGGVFQNRLLMTQLLREAPLQGVRLVLPHHIPLNDGGVALGQLMAASIGGGISSHEGTFFLKNVRS